MDVETELLSTVQAAGEDSLRWPKQRRGYAADHLGEDSWSQKALEVYDKDIQLVSLRRSDQEEAEEEEECRTEQAAAAATAAVSERVGRPSRTAAWKRGRGPSPPAMRFGKWGAPSRALGGPPARDQERNDERQGGEGRGMGRRSRGGGGIGDIGDGTGALALGEGRRFCSGSGKRTAVRDSGAGGDGGGASDSNAKREGDGGGARGGAATRRKGVEEARGATSVARAYGGEGGGADDRVRVPPTFSAALRAGAREVGGAVNEPSPTVLRAGAVKAAGRGMDEPFLEGEGKAWEITCGVFP